MVSKRNKHEQAPPSLPSERLSFSLFWATRFWSIITLPLVYAMLRIYLPREAVMSLAKQYAIGSQELTIRLPQRYAKTGRNLRVNGPWFLYKKHKADFLKWAYSDHGPNSGKQTDKTSEAHLIIGVGPPISCLQIPPGHVEKKSVLNRGTEASHRSLTHHCWSGFHQASPSFTHPSNWVLGAWISDREDRSWRGECSGSTWTLRYCHAPSCCPSSCGFRLSVRMEAMHSWL